MVCQCPLTGFLHFYVGYKFSEMCIRDSFYVGYKFSEMARRLCQCPLTGFLHFYNAVNDELIAKAKCVNAL